MKKQLFESKLNRNFKKINKVLCDMKILDKCIQSKIESNLQDIETIKQHTNQFIDQTLQENKQMEYIKDKNYKMLNTIYEMLEE